METLAQADAQQLPASPDAMTPGWLNAALAGVEGFDSPIVGLTTTNVGAGRGFTSDLVRVERELERPGASPSTLIAKFSTGASHTRDLMKVAYARESTFYARFQADAPVRSPRCYFVAYQPEQVRYVLLLEDLGHLDGGDQIEGTSDARVETAVRQLARLHAHFWNHPDLRTALPRAQDDIDFESARELFREGLGELRRTHSARYPRFLEIAEVLLGMLSIEGFDPKLLRPGRGDHTLLHGDYRLDNMFFGDEDGAITFIDWVVRAGRGGGDLGYFLFQSLTTEQLHAHGSDLMKLYHRTLREHGVHRYSLRKVRSDCEMVLAQLVSNQLIPQAAIARAREGRVGTHEPVEGDGPEALRARVEALLATVVDNDRAVPLFETLAERLEAALEVHPRVIWRVRMAVLLIRAQILWRRMLGRR